MDQAVIFRDLLNHGPKLSPADSQRRAATELPECVRQSALTWWPDRTETNGTGRRLVIGVAVWSNYDLRLLDLVNEVVLAGNHSDVLVAVFDIDAVASQAELQRIFPGIGEVIQTPAVGYWDGGQLKETASGFSGRQLVGRVLGFDPQLAVEQPVQTAG